VGSAIRAGVWREIPAHDRMSWASANPGLAIQRPGGLRPTWRRPSARIDTQSLAIFPVASGTTLVTIVPRGRSPHRTSTPEGGTRCVTSRPWFPGRGLGFRNQEPRWTWPTISRPTGAGWRCPCVAARAATPPTRDTGPAENAGSAGRHGFVGARLRVNRGSRSNTTSYQRRLTLVTGPTALGTKHRPWGAVAFERPVKGADHSSLGLTSEAESPGLAAKVLNSALEPGKSASWIAGHDQALVPPSEKSPRWVELFGRACGRTRTRHRQSRQRR